MDIVDGCVTLKTFNFKLHLFKFVFIFQATPHVPWADGLS